MRGSRIDPAVESCPSDLTNLNTAPADIDHKPCIIDRKTCIFKVQWRFVIECKNWIDGFYNKQ
jgi:hypothetical protein